jgi:hypothetical protein
LTLHHCHRLSREVAALLEAAGSFKKELSIVKLNEIFDLSKRDAHTQVIDYLSDRLQLRRGSLPPQNHVDLAERAFKSKEGYGPGFSSARFFNHMARAGDRRATPVASKMIAGTYGTHVVNDGVYVLDNLIDSEASESTAKSEFSKLSTKERAATYKGLANILKTSLSNSERLRTLKVFGTIARNDAKDLESELLVKCAPAQEACGTSNSRIPATAYLDLLFGGLPVFTALSESGRSQKIEIDPALMTQAQTLATELSQRITK